MNRRGATQQQIARVAEITDPRLVERLGVMIGTTVDGKLLMSKGDWDRLLSAGAVRLVLDKTTSVEVSCLRS